MPLLDRITAAQARALALALYVGAPLGYGILSVLIRQDHNWDLLNYHHYNPWAWLNDRRGHDIDAAILPGGYFNPLLHLPLYLAHQAFPPRLVGFLIGAVQGLNAVLLYWIARAALPGEDSPHRTVLALGTALIGTIAAGNLGQIGASFGDNVLSLLILGSLAILATGARDPRPGRALLAGLLLGLAAGLKPTMGLYAPGLGLACLALAAPVQRRIVLGAILAIGAVIGWAITGGFWAIDLWRSFGNPLFPFFNDVFKSPWAAIDPHKNLVYLPRTWIDALTLPWRFPFNARLVGEIRFTDLRIPILYSLAWIALLAAIWNRGLPGLTRGGKVVLVMLAGSFAGWLWMFAIYRYLITVELLAPLGIVLLLGLLVQRLPQLLAGCAVLLLLILLTLRVGSWGHVPWHPERFGVEAPAIADPASTMVLLPGTEPAAFVIPSFPKEVRFVRVSRWILDSPDPPTGLEQLAYSTVATHRGPFFAIFRQTERGIADGALALRGLTIPTPNCPELTVKAEAGKRDRLVFCPVERKP